MKHPNLFLIGFMGSGKTHWGKILSKKFGIRFLDLDDEIESSAGQTVEQIFDKRGEDRFRLIEKEALRKIEKDQGLVVACGGGTPCFHDNIKWMLANGVVIYLKATPAYLLDRVMDETDSRPLLKELNPSELLFFIQKTLAAREAFYSQAHYTVEVAGLDERKLSAMLQEITSQKISNNRETEKQSE